jgi:hypothetical protein
VDACCFSFVWYYIKTKANYNELLFLALCFQVRCIQADGIGFNNGQPEDKSFLHLIHFAGAVSSRNIGSGKAEDF